MVCPWQTVVTEKTNRDGSKETETKFGGCTTKCPYYQSLTRTVNGTPEYREYCKRVQS